LAIRCHLRATVKAAGKVVHEMLSVFGIATAAEPIADQLAIRANRGPRPNVAGKGRCILGGGRILLFGVNERPNFITLNAFAVQPLHVLIVKIEAGFATMLMETTITREIDRMEEPSTSMERIWTRFSRGSLFMPSLYELLCLALSIFLALIDFLSVLR
jgi:hypothetical protein